jgi:hypothetical protein
MYLAGQQSGNSVAVPRAVRHHCGIAVNPHSSMTQPDPALPLENIPSLIRVIRDQRVILDTDLARLYCIPTFRLNEAVKRNGARFPDDFLFQLTPTEREALTSQIAMSKTGRGGRRSLPFAFTEHGALMAANILKQPPRRGHERLCHSRLCQNA